MAPTPHLGHPALQEWTCTAWRGLKGAEWGRAGQEPTCQQLGVFLVHQVGEVSSVVQDHVERRSVSEVQRLLDAPHVLLVRLALPGVNWKNKSQVTSCLGATPSSHRGRRRVPGTPVLAMAAAAWSWVEKMLQLDHWTCGGVRGQTCSPFTVQTTSDETTSTSINNQ